LSKNSLELAERLREELQAEVKGKRELHRQIKTLILEKAKIAKFYPSSYDEDLYGKLDLTNRQVRTICDQMVEDGRLLKGCDDEYNGERGRELKLVWYILKEI